MAFTLEGKSLIEKAKEAMLCIFSEEELGGMKKRYELAETSIKNVSKGDFEKNFEEKTEATRKKIEGMAESYLHGNWSEASEVAEWMGFFHGAALAHWNLVKGAAEGAGNEDLMNISLNAIGMHEELLCDACAHLSSLGVLSAEGKTS